MNVEGHFEARQDENPDFPVRWVLRRIAPTKT